MAEVTEITNEATEIIEDAATDLVEVYDDINVPKIGIGTKLAWVGIGAGIGVTGAIIIPKLYSLFKNRKTIRVVPRKEDDEFLED